MANYRHARKQRVPEPPSEHDDELEWEPAPQFAPSAPAPSHLDPHGAWPSLLAYLRQYDSAYANVTAADLPKLLLTTIDDGTEPAIDIMAEVRAYFQGSYRLARLRAVSIIPLTISSKPLAALRTAGVRMDGDG